MTSKLVGAVPPALAAAPTVEIAESELSGSAVPQVFCRAGLRRQESATVTNNMRSESSRLALDRTILEAHKLLLLPVYCPKWVGENKTQTKD